MVEKESLTRVSIVSFVLFNAVGESRNAVKTTGKGEIVARRGKCKEISCSAKNSSTICSKLISGKPARGRCGIVCTPYFTTQVQIYKDYESMS